MAILWVLLGVAALIGVSIMYFYNGMVRGRNQVEEAWSGISVQLKRRHDVVPNLVALVRQYAAHEKGLFESVSELRAKSMEINPSVAAQANAENALSGALRSLIAVAEAYPDLKANTNFLDMQQQLATLEDEIQMARRYYNGTARDQNNMVQQFPGNVVANSFKFGKVEYFELDDPAEKAVPNIASLLGN